MHKRIICIFLIMNMIFLLTGVCAQGAETAVYASDFSRNEDGWYGRGAVSFRTADHTLRTESRSSDWNSPGRDFALIEGTVYDLSVEIRQDSAQEADFMISVAHARDGAETYENLARGTVPSGEWTRISGTYQAGDYERFVLYVETSGAGSLPFEIRNFQVSAPYGEKEPKPTEAPMVIQSVTDLPRLREVYAEFFDFGAAVPRTAFSDSKLMVLMLEQFTILTPENELKPDAVLDVPGSRKLVAQEQDEKQAAVHLTSAKPLLDFAKKYGMKVHGHVLVWHSQTPAAFFHEGYDETKPLLDRETMLGRLENYIRNVMELVETEYPGVIVSWDVLNEAIDDGTGWLRNSSWLQIIGEDFPNRAFEYARRYAPEGVKLYYNDYNTAYSSKRAGIIRLLKSLMAEGNIDGYGFQMHHTAASPSMQDITASVESIAKLGLSLRVSELDVGVSSNSESAFKKQAEKYAAIMKLLKRYSDQFEAVQVWGLNDSMSWRSREYPLLLDGKCNPKPAFWAVVDPDAY